MASKGFTELYDLPAEEAGKIGADDTALMLFGFRFLRQVLFGENTISLKQKAAEMRRSRISEKMQQIEAKVRKKRAAEQDDMYEDSVGWRLNMRRFFAQFNSALCV